MRSTSMPEGVAAQSAARLAVPTAEPRWAIWGRRAVSIPMVFTAALVAWAVNARLLKKKPLPPEKEQGDQPDAITID